MIEGNGQLCFSKNNGLLCFSKKTHRAYRGKLVYKNWDNSIHINITSIKGIIKVKNTEISWSENNYNNGGYSSYRHETIQEYFRSYYLTAFMGESYTEEHDYYVKNSWYENSYGEESSGNDGGRTSVETIQSYSPKEVIVENENFRDYKGNLVKIEPNSVISLVFDAQNSSQIVSHSSFPSDATIISDKADEYEWSREVSMSNRIFKEGLHYKREVDNPDVTFSISQLGRNPHEVNFTNRHPAFSRYVVICIHLDENIDISSIHGGWALDNEEVEKIVANHN